MTVGVAVIGTGRAGMIHARALRASIAGAELVTVSDPDEASRHAAAQSLGLATHHADHRAVLDDPRVDAVVVVTPTAHHHRIVLDALAAGKHVLCEKPMAMNAAQCAEMIEAARAPDRRLQIGFMRRFDAGFRRAKELVDDGAIGKVVAVKSMTHGPSTPHPWMYDLAASNGPLAEVSSHDIDTVRWLTGAEVRSVFATGGNHRSPDARAQYPNFYDTVLMTCEMTSGAIGSVDGAQGVRYGYDARVEVHGTDGRLDIGDLTADRVVLHARDGRSSRDIVPSWRVLFEDAYVAEDAAFVEAVAHGSETQVTGVDGLRAVEIVTAGNESLRTGEVVRLG